VHSEGQRVATATVWTAEKVEIILDADFKRVFDSSIAVKFEVASEYQLKVFRDLTTVTARESGEGLTMFRNLQYRNWEMFMKRQSFFNAKYFV
jgi:hypothetical protein